MGAFKRGKNNPLSFYDDETILGYVLFNPDYDPRMGKTQFSFTVSTYDKVKKQSSSFRVTVPHENEYQYIRISDVQIVGEMVNIIALNTFLYNPQVKQTNIIDIHLYKLNLDTQAFEAEEVLLKGDSTRGNNSLAISVLTEMTVNKQSSFAVFQIMHNKLEQRNDDQINYIPDYHELIIYNYKSQKLIQIQDELIATLLKNNPQEMQINFSENELILTRFKDLDKSNLIRFNLTEAKTSAQMVISPNNFLTEGYGITSVTVANIRLFLLGNSVVQTGISAPTVIVVNLNSGVVLYEGYISRKDNKPIRNLGVNNILIE